MNKEYHKIYYEKNRKKIIEYQKKYRKNNYEKILQRNREYNEKNKIKLKEYHKIYYQKNRISILERQNNYNHSSKLEPKNENKPLNIIKGKGKAGVKTALIINNLYRLQQKKEAFIKQLQS